MGNETRPGRAVELVSIDTITRTQELAAEAIPVSRNGHTNMPHEARVDKLSSLKKNRDTSLVDVDQHYEKDARKMVAIIDVERQRAGQIILGRDRTIYALKGELREQARRVTAISQVMEKQQFTIADQAAIIKGLNEQNKDNAAEILSLESQVEALVKKLSRVSTKRRSR